MPNPYNQEQSGHITDGLQNTQDAAMIVFDLMLTATKLRREIALRDSQIAELAKQLAGKDADATPMAAR